MAAESRPVSGRGIACVRSAGGLRNIHVGLPSIEERGHLALLGRPGRPESGRTIRGFSRPRCEDRGMESSWPQRGQDSNFMMVIADER